MVKVKMNNRKKTPLHERTEVHAVTLFKNANCRVELSAVAFCGNKECLCHAIKRGRVFSEFVYSL